MPPPVAGRDRRAEGGTVIGCGQAYRSTSDGAPVQGAAAAIEWACSTASIRRQLDSDCAPAHGHTRQNETLRVEPRQHRRREPWILHAPRRGFERLLRLTQLRSGLA